MYKNISNLKNSYLPELYYLRHLSGAFGRASKDGWHAWNGLCPFHNDKSAGSFSINKNTGAFNCFSCGERGGDIIDFHSKLHRIGFKETVRKLLEDMSCVK